MWHVYYKSHIISIWMTTMHRIYIYRTRKVSITVKKEISTLMCELKYDCTYLLI